MLTWYSIGTSWQMTYRHFSLNILRTNYEYRWMILGKDYEVLSDGTASELPIAQFQCLNAARFLAELFPNG